MLRHIVFIKNLNTDSDEKTEQNKNLRNMLNALKVSIPQIKYLEVGENISERQSAFDISLIVDVENEEALNKYRIHPKHKKVLDFMGTLNLNTAVVDYLINE